MQERQAKTLVEHVAQELVQGKQILLVFSWNVPEGHLSIHRLPFRYFGLIQLRQLVALVVQLAQGAVQVIQIMPDSKDPGGQDT